MVCLCHGLSCMMLQHAVSTASMQLVCSVQHQLVTWMMVRFQCWQVILPRGVYLPAVTVAQMCCACSQQVLAYVWAWYTQPSTPLSPTLSSSQECHFLQCRESDCTEPCMLLPPGLLATVSGVQAFACGMDLASQVKTKLPAASLRVAFRSRV